MSENINYFHFTDEKHYDKHLFHDIITL